MSTTSINTVISNYAEKKSTVSLLNRFLNWCEGQQENRLTWLAIALAGHGCILTPLTIAAVVMSGTSLFLFILAIMAMGMALVTNLAAMPTKYTIPFFFMSILIDIVIIICSLVMGVDIANTYI